MIIKNDIEHMPIEKEIKHIIDNLNLAIKKLKCKKLLLNNNNTLEDIAFLEIYKHNDNLINADLLYMNNYNDKIKSDNISYIGNNIDILLNTFNNILNNNTVAIINTDTYFIEKVFGEKINYNIEIFKDYTTDFIDKIIEFYNDNIEIKTREYKMSKKSQEILKDYILHNDLSSKYTREELKNFQMELPTQPIRNISIYNSITANYIKGVNQDLNSLIE